MKFSYQIVPETLKLSCTIKNPNLSEKIENLPKNLQKSNTQSKVKSVNVENPLDRKRNYLHRIVSFSNSTCVFELVQDIHPCTRTAFKFCRLTSIVTAPSAGSQNAHFFPAVIFSVSVTSRNKRIPGGWLIPLTLTIPRLTKKKPEGT